VLSLTNVSSGQAGRYYAQKDNYYVRAEGRWTGKGSEALGLRGPVSKEDFEQLLAGKDPKGREIVAPAPNGEHRAGLDLTFSAPKSVSILSEVFNMAEVRDAHEEAVDVALRFVESHFAQARITQDGATRRIDTGNLVIATFEHNLSREIDPQLHTHSVVMNATETVKGWRALSNEKLYENKMLVGQVYRNELAANLKELGFAVSVGHKGLFEVEGIPANLLEHYSQRSEQIAQKVADLKESGLYPNANEGKLREIACLGSRVAKKEADMAVVREAWNERLREQGFSKEGILDTVREAARLQREEPAPGACDYMRTAIDAITARESTFTKEEALKTAARFSIGDKRIEELERAFVDLAQTKAVVILDKDNGVFTTEEMQRIERDIVGRVDSGRDSVNPLLSKEHAESVIQDRYDYLTTGQKGALLHILTSADRITGIQGDAGTGKTTMLAAVREEFEKEGYLVQGLSFTGRAAQELTKNAGIESRTLHSFLSEDVRRDGPQVWIVDESSMVGSRQMYELVEAAGKTDVRLVLIGDSKQLQAIDAGRMFQKLQEGGMRTARMTGTIRQKDQLYKEIVREIAEKRIDRAFEKMEAADKVHEIRDREGRLDAMVHEYVSKGDNVLIVTALNRDRSEINARVREALKSEGKLAEEHSFLVREPKSLNAIERGLAQSYERGDVVTVNRVGLGVRLGTQGIVIGSDERRHEITLHTKEGTLTIDVQDHADKIAVYSERQADFATGDKAVFLKNDRNLGLSNGMTGIVIDLDDKGNMTVKTDTDKEVGFNVHDRYNYLAHGYAVTDYKAQGQTSREVLFHADTSRDVSYNSFYVAVTRGEDDVHVYTDEIDTLKDQVKMDHEKTSTLDYPDKSDTDMEREHLGGHESKADDAREAFHDGHGMER